MAKNKNQKEEQDPTKDLQNMEKNWQEEVDPEAYGAPTMNQPENSENLVKWQLDIKEELTRIEHLLRNHVPKADGRGNIYYEEPPEDQKLFNEKGVNEILNLLNWYLNKNIILSNFDEKTIKERCMEFQKRLANLIHDNYQDFGLNTKKKIKHVPMIVMNLTNTVEAAYNRAMNGGERESLRTARTVTQSEPMQQGITGQQSKPGIFNPRRWIG